MVNPWLRTPSPFFSMMAWEGGPSQIIGLTTSAKACHGDSSDPFKKRKPERPGNMAMRWQNCLKNPQNWDGDYGDYGTSFFFTTFFWTLPLSRNQLSKQKTQPEVRAASRRALGSGNPVKLFQSAAWGFKALLVYGKSRVSWICSMVLTSNHGVTKGTLKLASGSAVESHFFMGTHV